MDGWIIEPLAIPNHFPSSYSIAKVTTAAALRQFQNCIVANSFGREILIKKMFIAITINLSKLYLYKMWLYNKTLGGKKCSWRFLGASLQCTHRYEYVLTVLYKRSPHIPGLHLFLETPECFIYNPLMPITTFLDRFC